MRSYEEKSGGLFDCVEKRHDGPSVQYAQK